MLLLVDDLLAPKLNPATIDQIVDDLFQEWLADRLATHLNLLKRTAVMGRVFTSRNFTLHLAQLYGSGWNAPLARGEKFVTQRDMF